jgi:type VI protein secretion system component VasK
MGQWAFYRMVSPGSLRAGVDRFRTVLSVEGFRHTFDVQAFTANNPFGLTDLKQFRCPETL